MIKAIIFDYGGVLSVEGSLSSFGEIYAPKLGVDPEELKRVIIDNWFKARISKMDSKLFWLNISKFLEIDQKILRKDLLEFSGFNHEVLDLIKKLKKNYKVGLLSNQIEDWLEEIIAEHKLNEVFDVITTSYKSKIAKPDISIFKEIVEQLGVNPTECIYIDDLEKNIQPAKELGMKMILFKNFEQLKKELISFSIKID
ncbi:MAG: HAD family phosphatase [Nanoarchaeota archaeon]|nr:HAD family phosphatase [Nanoarchaeota archaeon]MBU4283818.1 HAD family phosphatase [Nanoarchaeota archaeon]